MDGYGYGWDLCVGLLYEHRFAMLIMWKKIFVKYGFANKTFVEFEEKKHFVKETFVKEIFSVQC